MSDDLGSEAESAPPAPNGHAVPVAAVAGPQHPVWQRAAGGPPPPPTKHTATTRPGTTTTVNGRFVPISMVALELRARNEFDGASSVGSEPRHARERQQQHNNKKRTRPRGGDADDSEEEEAARDDGTSSRMRDECDDFDPLDDDANDEVHDDGSEAASGADVVANAAFGGGQKKKAKRRSGATTTALSVASDTESASSSQRRNAHCRAFPVPGVECVGCALPAKVTPVDDFVRSSCDKMQESALFKMSALVYQQKVAEPALAEGVHVPAWAWKDIRAHYTMHRMDARMQRFENMRTLAAMRKTLELTLLREDEASGEHVLDKTNSEQIMKIITLQSKEITLLHETTNKAAAAAAAANHLPGAGASKKRD